MIKYLSDAHFNHANIIKYCDRPFSSIEDMNKAIVAGMMTLNKGDTLVYLGDFSFGDYNTVLRTWNDWIALLNKMGIEKLVFIFGNHDKHVKRIREQREVHNSGTVVCNEFPIEFCDYTEIKDGNNMVVCCHYPIESWNGAGKGWYHLFGHTHRELATSVGTRRIHVGCDSIGYSPLSLYEIKSYAEKRDTNGL